MPPLVERAGLPLPPFEHFHSRSSSLPQLVPVDARADNVILLEQGDSPAFALIVEVQLGHDKDKPYAWPLYQATARARYRCPAAVVVIAPGAAVARWAATPLVTGQPGLTFVPFVLGPSALPRLTDPNADPHLATLSALTHGNTPGAPVVAAALAAVARLPPEEAATLSEVLWASLSGVTRKALEAIMDLEKWKEHSVLYREGEARGEARGLAPLRRLFERRFSRSLTEAEAAELVRRLASLGPERLGDVVLDLAPSELAAWLADPNAR